ncbi:uncharacterized protein BDFB_005785, partial [Asbolus verrucosus]
MFVVKALNKLRPRKQCLLLQTSVTQRAKSNKPTGEHTQNTNSNPTLGEMGSKYQVFRDQDSELILDIYEERNKYTSLLETEEEEDIDPLEGINLERGVRGVYDIEDLVDVLRRENSEDIFVAALPKEVKYVDYICVVTGKSRKHMQAIAQFVRKVYKRKMYKSDLIPKLEGVNSTDWMALDLDAYVNYLVPSITSLILYMFLFASDSALVFRHYKDDNPIWASLTLFLMYLPSLCSYILIVSDWELWPEMVGCGLTNFLWFLLKTLQHMFFPVWAMWRYAERIFWSIEAVRAVDEESVSEAITVIRAPRTIELYFFLQAFLQSLPQMLLQLNILMRQDLDVNRQTADAEVLSLVFNLTKVAGTVAFYQRFKTQKLAGKQYPWFKGYKKSYDPSIDQVDSRLRVERVESRPTTSSHIEEPIPSESRRSSDFYMEPNTPPLKELKEVFGSLRETSIIDGPNRKVYQEVSEPDFNIKRVVDIRGLPEDDLAGKIVSFFWWFCFLLVRILAISAFYYFYPTASIWLLVAHVLIIILFLSYDVKTDEVKRAKALFFVFIGLIYVFCIIEFKIKFKKTKFIYYGYFTLVFVQNFVMCLIWWFGNVEDLENAFWF